MVVEPGVDELEARSDGVEASRGFTKFDRDRVQLDVVEERRAFTGGYLITTTAESLAWRRGSSRHSTCWHQ